MGTILTIQVEGRDGARERREVTVGKLVIAGWTGRDPVALEKHIVELEALGVKRPASTPIFYRVSASRITTTGSIEATGEASSGEVEFVLLAGDGDLLVGVGSDHTDRDAETWQVTASKQMCEKPVAPLFWRFADVEDHWDRLVLRSFIHEKGNRVLYQEGAVASMLDPRSLISRYAPEGTLAEGAMMFCGTFAAKGGIRPSPRFEFELEDPVLGRRIAAGYDILTLPVLG